MIIKDRLKRAIITQASDDGRVAMGSTVTVEVHWNERTYQLVGPHEANPSQGRISHLSPVGAALLNRKVGETVRVENESGGTEYRIILIT